MVTRSRISDISRQLQSGILIVAALTLLCLWGPVAKAQAVPVGKHVDDLFIRYEFSKDKIYEHEGALVTAWLYTINPEIAYARELNPPVAAKNNFTYLSQVRDMRQPRRERIKGADYYVFPLTTYVVMMAEDGKFEIAENDFEVGVNVPVITFDPIWGEQKGFRTNNMTVKSPKTSFRIRKLPDILDPNVHYSGAVGIFEIKTEIPEGNIILNESSTAVITVRGKGLLGNDILPEYRNAFGTGAKLKSVAENTRLYFDGKNVISELELVCEFIPTDQENCEIGVVSLGYFNPETGHYETAYSEPVKVKVNSLSIEREVHDI